MCAAVHRVEMVMGTAITIDIVDPDRDATAAVEDAVAWFHDVDRRFSTYRPDSEVCQIDRGQLHPARASSDMHDVLDACEALRVATDGYFDAYATGRLDPSGYVKGWSVEVASQRLYAAGAVNHCVNAGGDIRLRGAGPDGQGWRIGITHPWQRHKVAWTVSGTDLAIATSGTYERGPHVIDPVRGQPADVLCSVTVCGAELATTDAYATAALAMGAHGIDWLGTLSGYESAVITNNGQAYRSDGFPVIDPDPRT
jgi:thiamine biosynthesis lipoprotein